MGAMKKDIRFEIRVTKDEKAELDRLAAALDISAAEVVRRAVLGLAKKVKSPLTQGSGLKR